MAAVWQTNCREARVDAGRPVRSLLWEVVLAGLRRWQGDGGGGAWASESLGGRIPGLDTSSQ